MMQMNSIAARLSRRAVLFMASAVTAMVALLPLQACNAGIFPNHYTFSRHQVQAAVQRRFPYQHSVKGMLDVTLENPVVILQPERNRLAVRLNARVVSPLLSQPVSGTFTVSSDLAWSAEKHAIILHSPSVDSVHLDGDTAAYTQPVEAALAPAVKKLLAGYAVYTLKPDQLKWLMNYRPGDITVLADGVRVQIVGK